MQALENSYAQILLVQTKAGVGVPLAGGYSREILVPPLVSRAGIVFYPFKCFLLRAKHFEWVTKTELSNDSSIFLSLGGVWKAIKTFLGMQTQLIQSWICIRVDNSGQLLCAALIVPKIITRCLLTRG